MSISADIFGCHSLGVGCVCVFLAFSKCVTGHLVSNCFASPCNKELSNPKCYQCYHWETLGEMSPTRLSSLTHTPGLWSSSHRGWQSRQQCLFTPHSHAGLEIFNPLLCALNWKQCGCCHQEEFLEQSISQSASTYWNICSVPGTY